jgi:hypothetical protein
MTPSSNNQGHPALSYATKSFWHNTHNESNLQIMNKWGEAWHEERGQIALSLERCAPKKFDPGVRLSIFGGVR